MSIEQARPYNIVTIDGKDHAELFPNGGSQVKYVPMEEYREIVKEVTQNAKARIQADQEWRKKQQTQEKV